MNYECNCGWEESDEWYLPYPIHDDECPEQKKIMEALGE